MNFRKIATVAGISAALVLGGGTAALAAEGNDNYFTQNPVAGGSVPTGPVTTYDPNSTFTLSDGTVLNGHAHVINVDLAAVQNGAAGVTVFWQSGGRNLVQGTEFTVHSHNSFVVHLTPEFLAQHSGVHNLVVSFAVDGVTYYSPIRLALPAAGNQGSAEGVRPVHPATGPAALVYGVGGLLLAGGGVSLVAAGKRRKAELV